MSGVSGEGVQDVLRALARFVTRNRKRQTARAPTPTWSLRSRRQTGNALAVWYLF